MNSNDTKKKKMLFGFIILLIVTGITFYFSNMDDTDNIIWDCSGSGVCFENNISHTYDCQTDDGNYDTEACSPTADGISEVTLKTDSRNHINTPLTDEEYNTEVLNTSVDDGWDIEFIENNKFIVTSQTGEIKLIENDSIIKEGTVQRTEKIDQTGLLGVAADPDFDQNNHIYLYFYDTEVETYNETLMHKLSRFEFNEDGLSDEEILIDEIEGGARHSGGRVEFGPDDKIYVTTGDAAYSYKENTEKHQKIQDTDFLGGKTLRVNSDGSIPDDNPYDESVVYTKGHRNVQGLDFNPINQDAYISEHGPWRHDEINVLSGGNNYGWPAEKCDKTYMEHVDIDEETIEPIVCFDEWTLAPSGITFVPETSDNWARDLFISGLRGNHLHRLVINENNKIERQEVFYFNKNYPDISQRIRDVEYNNGNLYLLTDDGHIKRIEG